MKARTVSWSCGLALLVARPALAADVADTAARLELTRGPGSEQCIATRALSAAVEARLQRHAFRQDRPATLYVRILLERRADATWSADISMRDGAGTALGSRSIVTRAAHCSALDDSLALVVALLVASPPVLPSSKASPETAPQPGSAATNPATPPAKQTLPSAAPTITLPRDTPARREPWLFNVSLEAAAALGALPSLAPGLELGLDGKPPGIPEIHVFLGLYPETQEQHAGANSGARFKFANAGLELCPWDRALGSIHWLACAGQTLGWLRVAAFGFDHNTTTSHLSYALLAWTGLTTPIAGAFAARLGIRAELPLERGTFTYGARDGSEQGLFEMKPVMAVLDAGLIVKL